MQSARLAHPSQKIISAPPKIQGSAHPSPPAPRPPSPNQPPSLPEPQEGPKKTRDGPERSPRGARGSRPTKKGPPLRERHAGGPGGRPPGDVASPAEAAIKSGEHSATPGGYGGKPPGVAFIGVPTGARNAGSGAPAGDQSTGMNITRKRPRLCQDLITARSQDDAEQANHEADKLSLERGGAGR